MGDYTWVHVECECPADIARYSTDEPNFIVRKGFGRPCKERADIRDMGINVGFSVCMDWACPEEEYSIDFINECKAELYDLIAWIKHELEDGATILMINRALNDDM